MTDEASPKPKKKRKKPATPSLPAPSGPPARTPGIGDSAAQYQDGKRWTAAAAVLLLVGVGLVATGETSVGPFATVAGMATAIWGAHRLGRSGPDGAAT